MFIKIILYSMPDSRTQYYENLKKHNDKFFRKQYKNLRSVLQTEKFPIPIEHIRNVRMSRRKGIINISFNQDYLVSTTYSSLGEVCDSIVSWVVNKMIPDKANHLDGLDVGVGEYLDPKFTSPFKDNHWLWVKKSAVGLN